MERMTIIYIIAAIIVVALGLGLGLGLGLKKDDNTTDVSNFKIYKTDNFDLETHKDLISTAKQTASNSPNVKAYFIASFGTTENCDPNSDCKLGAFPVSENAIDSDNSLSSLMNDFYFSVYNQNNQMVKLIKGDTSKVEDHEKDFRKTLPNPQASLYVGGSYNKIDEITFDPDQTLYQAIVDENGKLDTENNKATIIAKTGEITTNIYTVIYYLAVAPS